MTVAGKTISASGSRYRLSGRWRETDEGQALPVVSPVDGSVVGGAHEFTREEIDLVIASARRPSPAGQPGP